MSDIVTALIALLGTAIGTFGGIVASAKLTNYRIAQLEEKVEKLGSFAEKIPVMQEQIKTLFRRVDNK